MQTNRCLSAAVFLLASYLANTPAAAQQLVQFQEGHATCTLHLQAKPDIGRWKADRPIQSGQTIASEGGYQLTFRRSDNDKNAVWSVELNRPDGQSFHISHWAYEARTALGRVASIFDSQSARRDSIVRQAPQIDIAIEARPNRGVPFMMALDHYGNNSLAVGAIDQLGTYRITGRRIDDQYSILVARQEYAGDEWFTGAAFKDSVYVSTASASWYDAACAFADNVDRIADYQPNKPHPKADLPYYSTWYTFGEHITQDKVLEQARLASRLGCGNFLIFIGWSQCEDWFSSENNWGDYTPCQSRFSDFAGMIRTIQNELDMAVELWVAPTWIGAKSESFATMSAHRSKWPNEGYDRNLDPRSPAARRHIKERFAHMARAYGAAGFYVDFVDTLFNRNDAPHAKDPAHFGTAYNQFLAHMHEGFTSARPEPIAAFRMPFANLLSKHYATVFSTSYNHGDWNQARMFSIANRFVGRGVINRTDPLTWTGKQLDHRDQVGSALSAMLLLGPPGISIDLTQISPDRFEELSRWFAFYRTHRENIVGGQLRPFGGEYHNPEIMVHRGTTAYAWVSRWETSEIPFPPGTRHAFIFTALPEEPSFIARLHPGHFTGLLPGTYRARWYNSVLEAHDDWFEFKIGESIQRRANDPSQPIRTARENWDFHPIKENIVSLDIRRGGYLELQQVK